MQPFREDAKAPACRKDVEQTPTLIERKITTGNLKQDSLDYHAQGRPGKLKIVATKPMETQRDLSLAYSPGVAYPVLAIAENPELAFDYTAKGNLVAVISNSTAILGLGDRGPLAAKPVMEGKAVLFKRFADVDVFDIEVNSKDPEENYSLWRNDCAHLRRHQPGGHQSA